MADLTRLEKNARKERWFPPSAGDHWPALNSTQGIIDMVRTLGVALDLVIEVGSFAGVSTEAFCLLAQRVIAVDFWMGDGARGWKDFWTAHYETKNLSIMRMLSSEASKLVSPKIADLVYIDGNHNYMHVVDDIMNWMPKVKPGGWISGHDYHYTQPEVILAVDYVFGKPDAVFSDSTWLVKLKG
jgi:Methyltransferase domain